MGGRAERTPGRPGVICGLIASLIVAVGVWEIPLPGTASAAGLHDRTRRGAPTLAAPIGPPSHVPVGSPMDPPAQMQFAAARITFTLDILPRKGEFSTAVWGKVRFKKGVCATSSCGYRVYRNVVFRFNVTATDPKRHPFQFWVLPSGKKVASHRVTLKVTQPEALTAQFK
jgi:hypothetical protein